MNYKLWTMVGALAASAQVLAQEAAPPSTLPDDFKVLDREIGVSGDFLYGNGYVQLPIGEALDKTAIGGNVGSGKFTTADRKSALYYGGTLSGSVGKTWYVDVSYSRGTTEGSLNDLPALDPSGANKLESSYKISDEFYQLYGKYAFPQFSGTRFAAYLRLGATYSESTANVDYIDPVIGFRGQYRSIANDYLGNIGLGGEYFAYRGETFKITTVLEGEAFGGLRSSSITESLQADLRYDGSTDVDSFVYGGLGRGVLRFAKNLGREGRWKLNVDVGFQGRYLINEFESIANGLGDKDYGDRKPNVHGTELLWGPYGRVGLSYSF